MTRTLLLYLNQVIPFFKVKFKIVMQDTSAINMFCELWSSC